MKYKNESHDKENKSNEEDRHNKDNIQFSQESVNAKEISYEEEQVKNIKSILIRRKKTRKEIQKNKVREYKENIRNIDYEERKNEKNYYIQDEDKEYQRAIPLEIKREQNYKMNEREEIFGVI